MATAETCQHPGTNDMTDECAGLDRTEEQALNREISDEALELAASGFGLTAVSGFTVFLTDPRDWCC
jgi:hypothetical protein